MRFEAKPRLLAVLLLVFLVKPSESVSEGDIRLTTDRTTQNEGLVEIYYQGEWGLVDSNDITDFTASVICRLLGLGNKGYEIGYYYLTSTYRIKRKFSYIYCSGNENNILDCRFGVFSTSSYRYYGAGVVCKEYNTTTIRLEGGNDPSEGRVQFQLDGKWVPMCGDNIYFDTYNAVCRKMGYEIVVDYSRLSSSAGILGDVLPHEIRCSSRQSLNYCNTYIYSYRNCTQADDIIIKCGDFYATSIRLVGGGNVSEGRIEVFDKDMAWKSLCRIAVYSSTYDTICRGLGYRLAFKIYYNATFGAAPGDILPYTFDCYSYNVGLNDCFVLNRNYTCRPSDAATVKCLDFQVNDVRLADGIVASEGRIELLIRGQWMTVCSGYLSTSAADTICRTKGYRTAGEVLSGAYFGEGTGEIAMDYLSCNTFETNINNCIMKFNNDYCTHARDMSIRCTDFNITDVRLAGGNTSSEGRVELKVDGEWKTVCDFAFTSNDAQAVCRTLGYRVSLKRYNNAYFGQGTGKAIKHWLGCNSNNYHLNDCNSRYNGYSCGHSDDVSVTCGDVRIQDLRLVGGRHSNEGRLEVLIDGEWKTVCRSYVYYNDMHVICRHLGFVNMSTSYTDARFGNGTGDILTTDFVCNGGESDLNNCTIIDRGNTCTHTQDLSISCLACSPLSIPLHGYMQLSGTSHGDFVRFECKPGYGLIGPSFRVCGANNMWNGTDVSCIKDCGRSAAPLNGSVSFDSGTLYNATVVYSCDAGFDLIGLTSRICQEDGTWSGTSPVCQIKDCGPLTALQNGSLELTSGTVFMSSAVYTCDPGFKLHGTQSRVCQQDEKWSEEKPVCIVIPESEVEKQSGTPIWENGILYGGVALGLVIGITVGVIVCIVKRKRKSTQREHTGRDNGALTPYETMNSSDEGSKSNSGYYQNVVPPPTARPPAPGPHRDRNPVPPREDMYSYIDFEPAGLPNPAYTS